MVAVNAAPPRDHRRRHNPAIENVSKLPHYESSVVRGAPPQKRQCASQPAVYRLRHIKNAIDQNRPQQRQFVLPKLLLGAQCNLFPGFVCGHNQHGGIANAGECRQLATSRARGENKILENRAELGH
jgi:hypothetical protein